MCCVHELRDKVTSSHWNHHHSFSSYWGRSGYSLTLFFRGDQEEVQIGVSVISCCTFSDVFWCLFKSWLFRERLRIKGLAFKCLRLHSIGVISVSLCTHWNGQPFPPVSSIQMESYYSPWKYIKVILTTHWLILMFGTFRMTQKAEIPRADGHRSWYTGKNHRNERPKWKCPKISAALCSRQVSDPRQWRSMARYCLQCVSIPHQYK